MNARSRILGGIAAIALGATLVPAPAQAAAWSPKPANLFNVPQGINGTKVEQDRFRAYVEATLDGMPRGSVARLAALDINLDSTVDALLRAHRRGVIVRVIVDGGQYAQEHRLIQALGSDVKANRSYAVACTGSCNSAGVSVMHTKMFTASSYGSPATARKVWVIGSSNFTTTNHYLNYNESQADDDPEIYAGLIRAFDAMRFEPNRAAFSTFASKDGKYRVYMWPGPKSTDVHLTALKAVKCGPASKRTVVRMTMFYWTAARSDIARQLVKLRSQGCDVGVQVGFSASAPDLIAQEVLDILWKGKVPTWNTRKDLSGDGKPDIYAHSKFFIVDGIIWNKRNRVVWNGSANLSGSAVTRGNELLMRTDDDYTYKVFNGRWEQIKRTSTRITSHPDASPSAKLAPSPNGRARAVPVDLETELAETPRL